MLCKSMLFVKNNQRANAARSGNVNHAGDSVKGRHAVPQVNPERIFGVHPTDGVDERAQFCYAVMTLTPQQGNTCRS